MYLGRYLKRYRAKDNASLVVPRAEIRTVSAPQVSVESSVTTPQVVVVEKIVEKPVIVERVVEVEKVVEVPVAVAMEPQSNFFENHVPEEWVEQSADA